MSRILVIAAILITLYSQASFARISLFSDVLGTALGRQNIVLEWVQKIDQSILVSVNQWNLSQTNIDVDAQGLGIGYRYYLDTHGTYYFYGLGIEGAIARITESNTISNDLIYLPYYELGYTLESDSKFTVSFSLRTYYAFGQFRNINFPYLGLLVTPTLSAHYQL